MRLSRTRSRAEVARLRKARFEALERVGERPNLVGSMIGLKYCGGVRSKSIGLTLFVTEKVPEKELPPRHRIPQKIKTTVGTLNTDVVVWRPMVEQGLEQATLMYDGSRQGTLTCFGLRSDNEFGVSCAHCIAGEDRNPATPTIIEMWDAQNRLWLKAGKSLYAVYSPGPGEPGNFGYVDCGLFSLRDDDLTTRARNARPLRTVKNLYELLDQQLTGRSSLEPDGVNEPSRIAHVIGVEMEALDGNCDVILEVEFPGTFKGDSGMLWLTSEGKAAAIHARGEKTQEGRGSSLVTAMSAARAADYLQVDLAYG